VIVESNTPDGAPQPQPFRRHMGRLSRNVLIYGVTGAITRTATLALVPVLTSYLPATQHGVLSLLALLTAVLAPVLSLGLGAAAGACYFGGGEQRKSATIWSAFLMVLPGTLVLGAAAGLLAPAISSMLFGSADLAPAVRITLLSTACGIASLPFTMYLQFEERAAAYSRVMIASASMTTVATLAGVMWLRLELYGVVYAALLGQALLLVLVLAIVAPRLPAAFDRAVLGELLRVGLPLVPGFGFVLLAQQGNKFLLEHLSGLGPLGIYALGFNLGFASSIFVAAFQTAWLPFAMSFADRWHEASDVFGRVMTYYVIGGGLLTMMFFAGARWVVLILATPAFHDAYVVIGLSAAAQFFSGLLSILLPAVYFARQVQYVTAVHAASTAVMVAASLLLIPVAGILGAGVALALAAAVAVPLQHAWNRSRRDRYLQVAYRWRRVAAVLGAYGVLAALSLCPRSMSAGPEFAFGSLIGLLAIATAYLALTRAERVAFRGMVGRFLPHSGAATA
jgi:O-antigen/teichoic acid export membrane protein